MSKRKRRTTKPTPQKAQNPVFLLDIVMPIFGEFGLAAEAVLISGKR